MITRSKVSHDGGCRNALKDVSNKVAGNQGNVKGGGREAKERAIVPQKQSRYNLRPRKKAAKSRKTQKKSSDAATNTKTSTALVPYRPPKEEEADDIDARDTDDIFVTAYVEDIYQHFRSRETTVVRSDYLKDHSELNEHSRALLIQFLIESHLKLRLVQETLYLTINILDRYLAKAQDVTVHNLKLVGMTSLFVASKYEEVWSVALTDCVYLCDKVYGKSDFIQMEETMLKAIDYRVSIPSAHTFLLRYLKAGADGDTEVVNLSYYILDGTLQSYFLLHFNPSQLAAAAVFVARKTAGKSAWTPTLVKYTQYREEEVVPVARAIVAVKSYCSAGLFAVNDKYSHKKYGEVSKKKLCSDF